MALTQVDRVLLDRCLANEPGAWNDFVDRYLGLIYHVIHYTAHLRSAVLSPEDVEDIASEILLQIVAKNYAVLRKFEGRSSLATYLTVIGRRLCIQQLALQANRRSREVSGTDAAREVASRSSEQRTLEHVEEIQRMLAKLPKRVREIVRLHFLEGRSYEEISTALNIPVNSIGPVLSRAKAALQKRAAQKEAAALQPSQRK